MKDVPEIVEEYIEELDAIIEEFVDLDPDEKEGADDFFEEIQQLRDRFDGFSSLSEAEQEELLEETETLFDTLSEFSDDYEEGEDEDDEDDDAEDDDEDEDDEDYEDEEGDEDLANMDPETMAKLSSLLSDLTANSKGADAEAIQEMQLKLKHFLSGANEEGSTKTIPFPEG